MSKEKISEQNQEAIDYLTEAKEELQPKGYTLQECHKVAVCRLILDKAGITDKEIRNSTMKAFMATHSSIGSNNSQCEQMFGLRVKTEKGEKVMAEFEA